jgi:hypothetical protein
MSKEEQTQRLRAILFNDWNPIGFAPLLPDDEYDVYLPGIIQLLESHCTAEQLEAHLAKIEKDWIGISSEPGNTHRTAENLLRSWKLGS